MKRMTWLAVFLAAPLVLPLLLTSGGCHHDRDDYDRHSEGRERLDNERHEERHDAVRRDDDRRDRQ